MSAGGSHLSSTSSLPVSRLKSARQALSTIGPIAFCVCAPFSGGGTLPGRPADALHEGRNVGQGRVTLGRLCVPKDVDVG